mmetsp:Transcript_6117/g.37916  ORF Transcript_6117/g.37916 Transcript_6117/m.37916 type:complete len:145 (+) Transcript_6117:1695-2129(+)
MAASSLVKFPEEAQTVASERASKRNTKASGTALRCTCHCHVATAPAAKLAAAAAAAMADGDARKVRWRCRKVAVLTCRYTFRRCKRNGQVNGLGPGHDAWQWKGSWNHDAGPNSSFIEHHREGSNGRWPEDAWMLEPIRLCAEA